MTVEPPSSFDSLLHDYIVSSGLSPSTLPTTPWTQRALSTYGAYPAKASTNDRPAKSGRKFKPVHRKYRPVPSFMPDPAAQVFTDIPELPPLILPFDPPSLDSLPYSSRITRERLDILLSKIPEGMLWPKELLLLAFIVTHRPTGFAFEYAEKGEFSPTYYPDYVIPVIEHTPWVKPPIPIPIAIRPQVQAEVRRLESLGKFEASSASYRSALFAVAKKPGSVPPVRLVINVEELNSVTVRDSALPPNINDFAESFVGYSIYGIGDMFSGFDACRLDPVSRPLTTCHAVDHPIQACTLVQGCTNSVQEFSRRTDHALKRVKSKGWVDNFIDDCGVRGPLSRYNDETVDSAGTIRRFVFEYFVRLDAFLASLIAAGITVSGHKTTLAIFNLTIVGSLVSHQGWIVGPDLVSKVLKWPVPIDVGEIRMFLGLAGGARRWIKNYAQITKPLTVLLLKSDDEFEMTTEGARAVEILKEKLTSAPVLARLDYDRAKSISLPPRESDDGLVSLGVDSSWMGAGWVLYQHNDAADHPTLFGSCTFNKTQQNYGQPKTEVFGVFMALKAVRHRVWGIHFRLKHDAISLAKMLRSPDNVPNAPMLRWVTWIQLFDFETLHVPATSFKMEDSLSRVEEIDTGHPNPADDAEEFLDAYDMAYGSHDTITPGSTPTSVSRFVLSSLRIRGSNPFDPSASFPTLVPFPHSCSAIQISSNDSYTALADSFYHKDAYSLFHVAALANPDSSTVRSLPEFFHRSHASEQTHTVTLGDETFATTFTVHAQEDTTALSAAELCANVGHKQGTRDADDGVYWHELRLFLHSAIYPTRLKTDASKLAFLKRSRRFILKDEKIWLVHRAVTGKLPRLVVEDLARRRELMLEVHLRTGHRGRDATHRLLSDSFYWPNLYDDVSYFVRSCIECQKSIQAKPVLPYSESWLAPLLRHWDLDTIHMPGGVGGMEYVIQAIERTILWPEARAIKQYTAKTVAKFIYEDLVCRYACIPVITIDGGSEFKGEVQFLLRTLYRCTVIMSTAYHPEGNAPIERHHQMIVGPLFKLTGDAKGTWPRFIHAVLFALRITVSRATGFSPYYLLYGQFPVFSWDADEVTWQTLDWDTVRTHEDLIVIRAKQIARRNVAMQEANDKLRATRRRAIEDLAKKHHFAFDFSDYQKGMYVWLRESKLDEIKGGKGEWTYAGPYVIHEVRDHDSYVLRELSGAVIKGHVNVRRLRLFYFRPDNQTLRTRISVAAIHDSRKINPANTLRDVYAYRAAYGFD